ncbi:MAG TPA: ABC transporter permease [Mycobacteriales bacterium]|nr:ABC transporter permease [Mycobacteriales bacterium]
MNVLDFLTDGSHWHGTDGIPHRVLEQLYLTGMSMLIAVLLAVPLALTLGHLGRGGFIAVNTSNIGRAMPSLALLGIFSQVLPRGYDSAWPSIAALVALGVPPLVTNTYVGVREVDKDVVEAARGMGLSAGQVLRRVELPLALPLIMAGLRTSTTNVLATATLAALFAQGGLGRFIVDGQATSDEAQMFAGALLVAALALLVDALLALAARRVSPLVRSRRLTRRQAAELTFSA